MICVNKTLALIPLMVAMFALMLSPAVMSVSADKGGNDKAKGEPQGCDNEKGQDAIQNPNCNGGNSGCGSDPLDCDGDGLSDEVENQSCTDYDNADSDGDGVPDGEDSRPCDPANP